MVTDLSSNPCFLVVRQQPRSTRAASVVPYTTLSRSQLTQERGVLLDDQINLSAHLVLDQLDHACARFIREFIAVNRLAVETLRLGELVECGGVVPARGAGLLVAAGLFKEHAECVGAKAECGSDEIGRAHV